MLKKIFNIIMITALTVITFNTSATTITNTQHFTYFLSIDSATVPSLPEITGAKWIQLGSCNSSALHVMEEKVKHVASDSIITGLLTEITSNKYALNPQLNIFLSEIPAGIEVFNTSFSNFIESVHKNISTCSKKTYKYLESWLRKEAQISNANAESASVEYESYGETVVTAIETYFTHANTTIINLISYIAEHKPIF